jgi:hemoglobin
MKRCLHVNHQIGVVVNQTLYEIVGGLPALQKVHKIFYDKVYAHAWLGQFFAGHDQKAIEDRQTSFMAEKMGGSAPYLGKELKLVHETMYITRELFEIRKALLEDSLQEAGVDEVLIMRWLKIDSAFKHHIIKDSVESMYDNDWKYKKPIIIPNPLEKK